MANELFFSEGQQELVWRQQQQREKGLWSSWRRSTQERVARAVADLPKETEGYPIDYLMREDFSTGQRIVVDGSTVLV
jgi:hypothetical protein